MYECQRRMDILIQYQTLRLDPKFIDRPLKQTPELILPYLADKCGLPSKLVQHSKYIARSAARACLKQIIPLVTLPVHRKINQHLAQCGYVI